MSKNNNTHQQYENPEDDPMFEYYLEDGTAVFAVSKEESAILDKLYEKHHAEEEAIAKDDEEPRFIRLPDNAPDDPDGYIVLVEDQ